MANPGLLLRRFPLAAFFVACFAVSAVALVIIGPPRLSDGARHPDYTALLMFPIMVLTVAAAGIGLTAAVDGRAGLKHLRRRASRWRLSPASYTALLIPPAAILAVLLLLTLLVSRDFAPGLFPIGIAFGAVAGFLEEFGWTGFAYPRLSQRFGASAGAVILGLLWGLWHLPIVDSLGAASPHGHAWPLFFAAFVAVLTALRTLIARAYSSSGSLLLAQLTHASSTGSLVLFGASAVSPGQEAAWYALYAIVLALVSSLTALPSSSARAADPSPAASSAR